MATGTIHWYTVSLVDEGTAYGTPAPFVYDTTRARTLITFNSIQGDRIVAFRCNRTAGTGTTYDVAIFSENTTDNDKCVLFSDNVAVDATLPWDYSASNLDILAHTTDPADPKLYVATAWDAGADNDITIEIGVAPSIGGY